jgi:hypothetical protein
LARDGGAAVVLGVAPPFQPVHETACLKQYLCRAECAGDVECFLAYMVSLDSAPVSVVVEHMTLGGAVPFPDVNLSFRSPLSLKLLRMLILRCHRHAAPPGIELHVMYESLQTAENYTGERVLDMYQGDVSAPAAF